MGLDLVPLGKAKPGHEAEWANLMKVLYDGAHEGKRAAERRDEISIKAYEAVGAPRVGFDAEADAWAIARKDPARRVTDAQLIEHMRGYFVVDLMRGKCDGVPQYTNGGLYDGIDETSFRGAFLESCEDLLGEGLLGDAWTEVMRPEEAVDYGKRLLAAAEAADAANPGRPKRSAPPPSEDDEADSRDVADMTLDEKIEILRAAGRWYVFWGERGHPIAAWF